MVNLKKFRRKLDGRKRHTSIVDFPQPYSEISAIGLTRFSNYILSRDKICSSITACKTIIVGNSGSGKTSLLQRASAKTFDEDTIHGQEGFVQDDSLSYKLVGNKLVNKVWDITGSPEENPSIRGYFEMITSVIITFDLSDFDWETSVQPWIDFCFEINEGHFLIFIVGTKMDKLAKIPEKVFEILMEKSYDLGAELSITSAKDSYNVTELFDRVAALSYEVKLATEIESQAEQKRQFAATKNEDNRINHINITKGLFQTVIKTINELKHVQVKKVGKVVTQGYMGILHSLINIKTKAKKQLNKNKLIHL